MNKPIISEKKQQRLDKYADLKETFKGYLKQGGQRTAIIKHMAKELQVSSATIYKAIKK